MTSHFLVTTLRRAWTEDHVLTFKSLVGPFAFGPSVFFLFGSRLVSVIPMWKRRGQWVSGGTFCLPSSCNVPFVHPAADFVANDCFPLHYRQIRWTWFVIVDLYWSEFVYEEVVKFFVISASYLRFFVFDLLSWYGRRHILHEIFRRPNLGLHGWRTRPDNPCCWYALCTILTRWNKWDRAHSVVGLIVKSSWSQIL